MPESSRASLFVLYFWDEEIKPWQEQRGNCTEPAPSQSQPKSWRPWSESHLILLCLFLPSVPLLVLHSCFPWGIEPPGEIQDHRWAPHPGAHGLCAEGHSQPHTPKAMLESLQGGLEGFNGPPGCSFGEGMIEPQLRDPGASHEEFGVELSRYWCWAELALEEKREGGLSLLGRASLGTLGLCQGWARGSLGGENAWMNGHGNRSGM